MTSRSLYLTLGESSSALSRNKPLWMNGTRLSEHTWLVPRETRKWASHWWQTSSALIDLYIDVIKAIDSPAHSIKHTALPDPCLHMSVCSYTHNFIWATNMSVCSYTHNFIWLTNMSVCSYTHNFIWATNMSVCSYTHNFMHCMHPFKSKSFQKPISMHLHGVVLYDVLPVCYRSIP